ncbi:hypothetical protein [Candidatus Synechococcus spongiarum]|uniref:hypothetical protein n=1 Tax=Candidatus Synechococcus spongiarum TaxID=431041 RepID=UPI0015D672DE|nr:hypothetical protein [Candidatus Synechococcus spongiarum]
MALQAFQEWQALERINTLEEIRQQTERCLTPSDDVGGLNAARKAVKGLIAIYIEPGRYLQGKPTAG